MRVRISNRLRVAGKCGASSQQIAWSMRIAAAEKTEQWGLTEHVRPLMVIHKLITGV